VRTVETVAAVLLLASSAVSASATEAAARDFSTTVSARRVAEQQATSFAQEIVGEAARRLPLIDDDLYRSLHLVPGVQADDYSARFSIRGGERDDVLVLLDGVALFDPFHLQDYGGAISSVDLGVVEQTTLLADGFPSRYADRMGGVLDVRTRRGGDVHEAAAGFDLLNAHARALGPLGDGDYLVSARRGYIDLFMSAWAPDVAFRPSYWDSMLKVSHPLGTRDRFAVYGLVGADHNEIDRDRERPALRSDYFNAQTWFRWQHRFDGGARLDSSFSYGRATRDRQDGDWGHDVRTLDHVLGQTEYTLDLGPRAGRLRSGGLVRWARGSYDYAVRDATNVSFGTAVDLDVDTALTSVQAGFHLQHDAKPLSWLRTTLGVRVDRVDAVDDWNTSPRGSLAVLLGSDLTLRAAVGLYHQPVTAHELPVETGVRALAPAERAVHRAVGLLWRPGAWLHARVEGYWRSYDRLVGHLPDFGSEMRLLTSPVAAEARGVELELRGSPLGGRVGWLVSYTLAVAEEWAAGGEPYARPGDRTHAVTAGLDLDLGDWGRLSAAARYHSGVAYTPVVGLAAAAGVEEPGLVFGAPYSERLPGFFSLDARWTRQWQFDSWALRGYAQVVNATLNDNVEEYAWYAQRSGSGWGLTRDEQGYFPILPTLGLEAVF